MNATNTTRYHNDRVENATPSGINERIEAEILDNIRYYAHNKREIPDRLAELEEEWDIERTLQLNAALLALTGTVLAATVNRRFAILTIVGSLLLTAVVWVYVLEYRS